MPFRIICTSAHLSAHLHISNYLNDRAKEQDIDGWRRKLGYGYRKNAQR